MTDVSLQFAPGTFEKLKRSAEKRSRLLNEDIRQTLTKTSLKVLVALRASARQSPKNRQVIESNGFQGNLSDRWKQTRMQDHIVGWYKQHGKAQNPTGRTLHGSTYTPKAIRTDDAKYSAVKQRFAGEHKLLPIPGAETMTEARKSKKAKIRKQGLARSSFTWMMGKLGQSANAKQDEIPGTTSVNKDSSRVGDSTLLSVKMSNRLKYIISSLQGGKNDVSTALQRARSMLVYDTRSVLRKRLR